ncbi:unnamed protein product [Calypogeia fissa]
MMLSIFSSASRLNTAVYFSGDSLFLGQSLRGIYGGTPCSVSNLVSTCTNTDGYGRLELSGVQLCLYSTPHFTLKRITIRLGVRSSQAQDSPFRFLLGYAKDADARCFMVSSWYFLQQVDMLQD